MKVIAATILAILAVADKHEAPAATVTEKAKRHPYASWPLIRRTKCSSGSCVVMHCLAEDMFTSTGA